MNEQISALLTQYANGQADKASVTEVLMRYFGPPLTRRTNHLNARYVSDLLTDISTGAVTIDLAATGLEESILAAKAWRLSSGQQLQQPS